LIPESERFPEASPGAGNGNLLQYSCLKNSLDRGAWGVVVNGAAKSWTRLSEALQIAEKRKDEKR